VLLSLKMTMNSTDSAGTTSSATPAAAALDDENNAFKNAAATSTDDKDTSSSSTISIKSMTDELLALLRSDPAACDVHVALFVSAANSYRFDSVLSPFPPILCSVGHHGEKDIDSLREIISSVPTIRMIKRRLEAGQSLPEGTLKLLHWILCANPSSLRLTSVPRKERGRILEMAGKNCEEDLDSVEKRAPAPEPTHIFKVENGKRDAKWKELEGRLQPQTRHYGFHGSRPENFFSILSRGLQQHLNKVSLFGSGIYLSTDLGMSLGYSKTGLTWDKSSFGNQMSCVVLSEVLDHADVKLHTDDPHRNVLSDSESGRVPEKYLIVRNNDLIANRFLLVFGDATSMETETEHGRFEEADNSREDAREIRPRAPERPGWIWQNKMLLLLVSYGMLLMAVGLMRSASFHRVMRKYGFWVDDETWD